MHRRWWILFPIFLSYFNYEVTKVSLQLIHIFGTCINGSNFPIIMGDLGGVSLMENFWPECPPPVVGPNSPPDLGFWGLLDTKISIKKCFIHNWKQTKKVALGGQHRNMNTVQIRLTHLFLPSSDIASKDLMGLNLYIYLVIWQIS